MLPLLSWRAIDDGGARLVHPVNADNMGPVVTWFDRSDRAELRRFPSVNPLLTFFWAFRKT